EARALARLRCGHHARRARMHGGRMHGVPRIEPGHDHGDRRDRLLRPAEGEHQPVREAGPLVAWPRKDARKNDPYWDFFIKTPPVDLANSVVEIIRNAPDGNVFPTRAELHTPEITSRHVK